MAERFHTIQVRGEDAAEVALAIAGRFRALSWKVVRDPKGRGAPTEGGDPDGLRRFLISPSDRGWVTILPSGTVDGPHIMDDHVTRLDSETEDFVSVFLSLNVGQVLSFGTGECSLAEENVRLEELAPPMRTSDVSDTAGIPAYGV